MCGRIRELLLHSEPQVTKGSVPEGDDQNCNVGWSPPSGRCAG